MPQSWVAYESLEKGVEQDFLLAWESQQTTSEK